MKKLIIINLFLILAFTGCDGCDTHHGVEIFVTNETSHHVQYHESGYSYNIELPSGQKTSIFVTNHGDDVLPVLGSFIFDDTLILQYTPSDTFSRSIYKNYEIEKPYDYKRNSQTYYYYTLTEEDYQNALQQNGR